MVCVPRARASFQARSVLQREGRVQCEQTAPWHCDPMKRSQSAHGPHSSVSWVRYRKPPRPRITTLASIRERFIHQKLTRVRFGWVGLNASGQVRIFLRLEIKLT